MSDTEKAAAMATEHSENLSVSEHHDTESHKGRVQQTHADGETHPIFPPELGSCHVQARLIMLRKKSSEETSRRCRKATIALLSSSAL